MLLYLHVCIAVSHEVRTVAHCCTVMYALLQYNVGTVTL